METQEVLEKILLPIDSNWKVTGVETNELTEEIFVDVEYKSDQVVENGKVYKIYDYRKMRVWRHLDLWQYKTYLRARVPRINDESNIRSIEIPWADKLERMTTLLEKKR